MTANPRPAGIDAEPLPGPRPHAVLDIDGFTDAISAEARRDPGTAVGHVNRVLLESFFEADAPFGQILSRWSTPHPTAARQLAGTIDSGRLVLTGRQHLRDLGRDGPAALLVVRDRNPLLGGYVARIEGDAVAAGEPIFGSDGFRERFVDIPSASGVAAFRPVEPAALDTLLHELPVVEDYLHAVIDLGLLQAFFENAHEHVTTRTRPWQGQSLAKATDDPHLVRRYGEYRTALSALEALVRDAALALKAGFSSDAMEAVAAARGYAILAGQSIISGTLELLGAGATSQRYGFDRFWSDFTAHAIAHPPLRSFEAIGRGFVRSTSGE